MLRGARRSLVDSPVAVALWATPRILNGADNLAGLGINCGDVLTTTISAEDAVSIRVVDNPVRVVSDAGLVEHSEGLEVEHNDRSRVGGADESPKKADPLFLSSISFDNSAAFYELKLSSGVKRMS